MDIIIRILIMLGCGIWIIYFSTFYRPFENFKELNIIEKILWGLFYIFIVNWFIIVPSVIFLDCFKYIFIK